MSDGGHSMFTDMCRTAIDYKGIQILSKGYSHHKIIRNFRFFVILSSFSIFFVWIPFFFVTHVIPAKDRSQEIQLTRPRREMPLEMIIILTSRLRSN